MARDISQELASINAKLSILIAEKKKQTWVPASVVADLTGWHQKKMEWARNCNLIEYRKKKESKVKLEYLLESIPEIYIVKKSA